MNLRPPLVPTVGRITLTKGQLQQPEIREFADLLVTITADGVLQYEELQLLTKWLNNHTKLEVPAVRFMFDVMLKVSEDGQITNEEIFDIQLAIERILPKEFRSVIYQKRSEVYYSQPPTNRQIMFLRFWDRMDLVNASRREVADWMNQFTNEDQSRWTAWAIFKEEAGDDGGQNDPSFVPIGVGHSYLQKVYQR